MKSVFEKIWTLAKPFLNTRRNDIHTEISVQFGFKLMEIEGGEKDVVIPAIILHDVGWAKVPAELQPNAFGPRAKNPDLNRTHELEGVKIAGRILDQINYDKNKTARILRIIEGHDSRKKAISLDDMLVKDADKLWRYSKEGFKIDIKRFEETPDEGLNRLRENLSKWFFTNTAKEMAKEMINKREREKAV